MSDVKAFNNCMSVFWRQHEAEFSLSDIEDR
jgi:arsenite-transporting ATPase